MTFNLQFNAQTVAPNTGGQDPVPTGIYTVAIVKSEEVQVQGKPGATFYKLDMQILDEGPYKGKFVYERLNCKNPSQQAVDIAFGTLSAICHVMGVMQIGQSSQELHGKPFKVNVVKAPRSDDPTKEGNEIRGYMDIHGNPPKGGSVAATAGGPATNASAFDGGTQTAAPAAAAAPPAPAAPPANPAAPPAYVFPPEGWQVHPTSPGWYYKGQEVVSEADLRAKFPPPAAAPTPPTPPAPGSAPAAGGAAVPSWAT